MKNICKDLDIPVGNVTDLNRCYKNILYEKNDIVKSTELYIQDNLTFVPLSVNWAQFLNPGIFVLCLSPDFKYLIFKCMDGASL